MKKYVVYTIVDGFIFFICKDAEGNACVKSDPSDDEIVTTKDKDFADAVALKNSKNGITYNVKEI